MSSNSRLKRARKERTRLREYHFHKQGGKCAYCNTDMTDDATVNKGSSVSLEHILPQIFGGRDTELNTVATCSNCNMRRSNRILSVKMLCRVLQHKPIKHWPTIAVYHVQTRTRLRRHSMTPF